jgi:type II secretory pathway component PulF
MAPHAAAHIRAIRGIRGLLSPSSVARGIRLARARRNPELRAVSLSLREKQSLYHSLGQLLRSGVPLPGALANLAQTAGGGQRRLLLRLQQSVSAGRTVGEALGAARPAVSEMEVGIVSAVERAGRMEQGMTQLARYFEALAVAREGILKKCAYPAFVLHFGIIVLALPTLIAGAGLGAYLRQTAGVLVLVYGIALVIALLIPLLVDAGALSAAFDSLLRMIPLLGKIRRAFAVARFCATYEMQLSAGINVMDALQAAQRASRSGLIRATVRRAVPEVRNGAQVGSLLAAGGAFPEPMIRAFNVGEQTGELDQELARLAADYQAEGIARLENAAEWLPRLFYVAIMLYTGYSIVTLYQKYLQDMGKLIDF